MPLQIQFRRIIQYIIRKKQLNLAFHDLKRVLKIPGRKRDFGQIVHFSGRYFPIFVD